MAVRDIAVSAAGSSGSSTYVDDVFSTYLYAGNGSTQTITNGIDLAGKGGLVWLKLRSGPNSSSNHVLFDTARGAGKRLYPNTTDAEFNGGNLLTSFTSSGFALDSSVYNDASNSPVSWTFRKAAKFFDVVTYTGNGVAGRQIAHSLGIQPGFVIVKRTDASGGWATWNIGAPSSMMFLNETNAASTNDSYKAQYFGNDSSFIAPTSTVITVGTNIAINNNGSTYVAYVFAHDTTTDGLIQCGSFTVSGTPGQITSVNLGWEPQWLLVKPSSSAGGWNLADAMRGMPVGSSHAYLEANTSIAETTSTQIPPTATGFNYISGNSAITYIYLAIRRPNKPPTSGTQVYNAQKTTITTNPQTVTMGFVTDLALRQDPSGGAPTWWDRLRGPALYLQSSNTNAESNPGANGFNNDRMDGWSDASSGAGLQRQYWGLRRAPGVFDVAAFTNSYNHNLGVVPELVIMKNRDNASDWHIYHSYLSTNYILKLNTAGGIANNTIFGTPTATTIPITSSGVASVTVTSNGSGYTSAPTVSFSGGGGSGAAGTAVLGNSVYVPSFGSSITSISVSNGGSGYTSAPTVSVSGGSGLSATANIGNITASVSSLSGSGGYTIYSHAGSLSLSLSGGGGSGVTISGNSSGAGMTLTSKKYPSFSLTSGGSGYTSTPTVVYSGWAPSNPTINISISGGQVVYNGASGVGAFDTVGTISFTGGGGTGATMSVSQQSLYTISDASAAFSITSGGSGYLSAPTGNVTGLVDGSCTVTGNLSNATAQNAIISVTINAGGSGYTYGSAVTFSGGGGSGAAGTAYTANNSYYTYSVTSVNMTSSGTGYSTAPTVSFSGGGGSGAAGTANITTAAGGKNVAYLFATRLGISKVGYYTGNGTSQTINCGFSTGARFILIKRADATGGDSYIWDSTRGIVAGNDPRLSLNTTAAEVTTDDSIDPDTTGFIVNQLSATNINVNSVPYIYLALA